MKQLNMLTILCLFCLQSAFSQFSIKSNISIYSNSDLKGIQGEFQNKKITLGSTINLYNSNIMETGKFHSLWLSANAGYLTTSFNPYLETFSNAQVQTGINYLYHHNNKSSWFFSANPYLITFSPDNKPADIKFLALSIYTRKIDEHWKLKLGAGYASSFDAALVLPILGFDYQINQRDKFSCTLPFKFSYNHLHKNNNLSIVNLGMNSLTLPTARYDETDDLLKIRELILSYSYIIQSKNGLKWSLTGGLTANRKAEIQNYSPDPGELKINTGLYFQFGIAFNNSKAKKNQNSYDFDLFDLQNSFQDTEFESVEQPTSQIPYPEGLTTNYITINSVKRKYLVYRPLGVTSVKAVVVVLHGGGGTGLGVAKTGEHPLSVFRTIADTAKFIVVYPEGSLDARGKPGWNDCRSDDISGSQGDDITFLKQLNAKLQSELNVNSSKMFLTGGSNGAIMTYSYAFQFPETIRAIAISSGNLPQFPESGTCTNGSAMPIPILITHGTSDRMMPADGGCVANLGGACNRGKVISQTETINYWLQRNNLQNVTPVVTTFDVNTNDAGNVEKRVYNGANPLVYFVLNNAGHHGPSKTVYSDSTPAQGVQNRDIEYAEEVWKFFDGLK